jgi:hypothetical protein
MAGALNIDFGDHRYLHPAHLGQLGHDTAAKFAGADNANTNGASLSGALGE